jgi:hypothetical protein
MKCIQHYVRKSKKKGTLDKQALSRVRKAWLLRKYIETELKFLSVVNNSEFSTIMIIFCDLVNDS